MEIFNIGFDLNWTFLIQVGVLGCLVVIMFDINKIRDHHQYMFEQKLGEVNDKLRKERQARGDYTPRD
tara:strand:- start:402 stop:605 length:204 start_codon:yes stop_codon:yes gene_type:complete